MTLPNMMKIGFCALCLIIMSLNADAKVLQLTQSNIDQLVAGKTVFIKFFAPWCGHCKAMAADWEKLAADWADHPIGLVAEVDCTDEAGGGQSLCEDFKVEGFPTIMYGDAHSPEAYEGGRDYESLSEFAKEHLSKPVCSVSNVDVCSDDQKAAILDLQKKSKADLEAIATDVENKINENQNEYEKALEELNDRYEKMTADLQQGNEELKKSSNYKLVKQILAQANTKSEDKEEL